MEHEQILNCPFCGGRAVLEKGHRAFIDAQTTRVALVRCTVCNARSGREKLSDYGCTSTSSAANEKVIAAWNSRANAIPVDWLEKKRQQFIDAQMHDEEEEIACVLWMWKDEQLANSRKANLRGAK